MDVSLVQKYTEILAELKPIKAELKRLDALKREFEIKMTESMQDDGLTLTRTDFGTPSLTKETVANVPDWPALEQYVYDNKALYLLQRRTSSPAFREMWKQGLEIPGVVPFEVTKFHFSTKTS